MVNFLSNMGGAITGGATVAITIKAIDSFSSELNRATTGLEKISSSAKIMGAAAVTAFTAFTASAVQAGMQMIPMEASFRKLTKSSDKFLQQLNEATKGTISNFELMANANKALLLGLDQEALPKLFENAAIVGRAAGRSTTEAIADITLGIGRQSRQILDNLGIIIKAEDVYEEFAVSVGKSTSELTAQERQMAFNKTIMEALQETANNLGGAIPEDFITDIQRINKGFQDFRVEFGKAFIENFSIALPKAEDDWKSFGKTSGEVVGIIAAGAVMGLKIVALAIEAIIATVTAAILYNVKPIETFINKIINGINSVIDGINKIKSFWGGKPIATISTVDFTSGLTSSLKNQAERSSKLIEEINNMALELNKAYKNIGKSQEQVTDNTVEQIKQLTKEQELIKQLAGFKIVPTTGDIFNPKLFNREEFESQYAYEQAKRISQSENPMFNITIENVIGLDPDEISRALSSELNNKLSI